MKRLLALTAVVFLSAGILSAGPLAPKDVGADAKWFGHINCEAIHALKLVQDLKDKCPMHKQCQAKMEELAKKLGMNPMEDVLGATLYSDRYGGHSAVVLIYVKKLDREKTVAMLKEKHPDNKTSEYGTRTLYSWTAAHHGKKTELTGTFANDGLVVIGAGIEQVKAALDVLDGKKPGLAADAPLVKDIPETALFASRGVDVPEEFRKTTRCPVLRNCKSASAVWSEKDGQLTGSYELNTVSDETAKSFKAIVEGIKAVGALHATDCPAVKKLIDGIKCNAEGSSFTATVSVSTADVEAAVKAVMEHKSMAPLGKKKHGSHEKGDTDKK
jgi:hypothetical protein